MTNAVQYFNLARTEEKAGNACAALLLYLSSFCDSSNSGAKEYPCGTIAKIQKLQNMLYLSDQQLFGLVYSYGPLSSLECRRLLQYYVCGRLSGIKSILSGQDANH